MRNVPEVNLLGLDLAVPDYSIRGRPAETLEVPQQRGGQAPVHLLVDSTGLKLCGPGEWLRKKHGTRRRRSWPNYTLLPTPTRSGSSRRC
jgi:hypothetical protein